MRLKNIFPYTTISYYRNSLWCYNIHVPLVAVPLCIIFYQHEVSPMQCMFGVTIYRASICNVQSTVADKKGIVIKEGTEVRVQR